MSRAEASGAERGTKKSAFAAITSIRFRLGVIVNSELIRLVKAWKASGSMEQGAFDWSVSQDNWMASFPGESQYISKLKSPIDRAEVIRVVESTEYSIREKFLAVMIWGYGNRGYGPYRVSQMLTQANSEAVLNEVYSLCRQGKPLDAYSYLRKNRLRQLGPSYGSKVLSFFTPRDIGAPILDSLIARWLKQNAAFEFKGFSTKSVGWGLRTYARYHDWISKHAFSLGCYPDEIEQVLFEAAEKEFSRNGTKQITKGTVRGESNGWKHATSE